MRSQVGRVVAAAAAAVAAAAAADVLTATGPTAHDTHQQQGAESVVSE